MNKQSNYASVLKAHILVEDYKVQLFPVTPSLPPHIDSHSNINKHWAEIQVNASQIPSGLNTLQFGFQIKYKARLPLKPLSAWQYSRHGAGGRNRDLFAKLFFASLRRLSNCIVATRLKGSWLGEKSALRIITKFPSNNPITKITT